MSRDQVTVDVFVGFVRVSTRSILEFEGKVGDYFQFEQMYAKERCRNGKLNLNLFLIIW